MRAVDWPRATCLLTMTLRSLDVNRAARANCSSAILVVAALSERATAPPPANSDMMRQLLACDGVAFFGAAPRPIDGHRFGLCGSRNAEE